MKETSTFVHPLQNETDIHVFQNQLIVITHTNVVKNHLSFTIHTMLSHSN